MKRIAAIALIVLALCLLGYGAVRNVSAGTASEKIVYSSEVLSEECFLCGNGMSEDSIPFYWGQENIALISLNTFEMKPIEIPDIADIRVDTSLPPEQRMASVLQQMNGNPYFFRSGSLIVKTSFRGEARLQTLLENCLETL